MFALSNANALWRFDECDTRALSAVNDLVYNVNQFGSSETSLEDRIKQAIAYLETLG